ncbi:HNH endonuclease signature motif containing protein [Dermacoccaceae bacterium W4C1]
MSHTAAAVSFEEPPSVSDALELAQAALEWAFTRVRDDCDAAPGEVLAQISQTQHLVDLAHAVQTHRIAQHATTIVLPESRDEDTGAHRPARAVRGVSGGRGLYDHEGAPSDLMAALQWGPRTAIRRCRSAVVAVDLLPGLVDELAAGGIDRERLDAVADALHDVPLEQVSQVAPVVEAAMLQGPRGGICAWTAAASRRRAIAAVTAADAWVPVARRRRKVAEATGVWFEPGQVLGTSVMTAVLPTSSAAQIKAAVEELAWRYRTDAKAEAGHQDPTPAPTLGQCRAGALVDLIAANANIDATCTVLVPVRSSREQAAAELLHRLPEALAAVGMRLSLVQDRGEHFPQAPGSAVIASAVIDEPDPPPLISRGPLSPSQSASAEPPLPDSAPWDPLHHASATRRLGDAWVDVIAALQFLNEQTTSPAAAAAAVDDSDAAGCDDVVIDGIGIIPAAEVAAVMHAWGARIGRALVDARTGAVREHTDAAYRPGAGTRRLVRLRDEVCRFPACTRPAEYTDADHVQAHAAGGPTTAANLMSLCRTHHRAKHSGAWQVRMDENGNVAWTSIAGATYTTRPAHEPAPF